MSDKKEIATLSIKISVDSTDLDNLEAQLKRIAGLMVNAGLKEPARGGFVSDSFGIFTPKGCLEPVFTISSGVTFINEACIENAALEKAMIQAAKEGVRKGAEQARYEITTGVNHNNEQSSAVSKFAKHNDNSIDSHAPNLFQEVEALKETVAAMLSEKEQERASIASLQCAITDSNHAHAETVRQFAIDMQRSRFRVRLI